MLVTSATESFPRLYAAPHVMLEVEEHAQESSTQAGIPVELFLRVWKRVYGSLLRVAGKNHSLLTQAERYRIEVLRSLDADDVPSAALAISLQAPLVSTDNSAVRAVYASQPAARGRDRLLTLLAEGCTSAQLGQMSAAAATATGLVGMGLVRLGKLHGPLACRRSVGRERLGREASEVLVAETPLVARRAVRASQPDMPGFMPAATASGSSLLGFGRTDEGTRLNTACRDDEARPVRRSREQV